MYRDMVLTFQHTAQPATYVTLSLASSTGGFKNTPPIQRFKILKGIKVSIK